MSTREIVRASGNREIHPLRTSPSGYLLAVGFGTAVAMWAVGYVSRVPSPWMPSWTLLLLLVVCQLAGGYVAARDSGRGLRAGAMAAVVTALINLLVLGSLLGGERPGDLVPTAALWIPGFVLSSALLGAIGAAFGRGRARSSAEANAAAEKSGVAPDGAIPGLPNWTGRFAWVAVAATLLLLIAGGIVTSAEAGLAVVDWPNSFGYNMFLFPMSRMTGGVYYEHAHRLMGALVGLTVLVLTFHLQRVDRRRWVKATAGVALAAVIVQGILGGLRVTGRFTTSTSPSDTDPNLFLAVVHGVLGQLIFALLVSIAVATSTRWIHAPEPVPHRAAGRDRRFTAILLGLLVVQLVLGAVLRHFAGGLHLHLTLAGVVIILGLVVGARASLYSEVPLYPKLGRGLMHLLGLQLLLGLGALLVVSLAGDVDPPPGYEVVVTTLHQATGALLLAWAVVLVFWIRRLTRPVA